MELGRIDIAIEVSMLSSHLALPREGHLNAVCHIFGYLKKRPKRWIAMDPTYPEVDASRFIECDWSDFYPGAKEQLPHDMPTPRGKHFDTSCWVDSDHAANRLTRRSQTGILLFCNSAPVVWWTRRQSTVETSTFGSEFNAMRIAVDLIEALRYKLRSFGIPVVGPTNVYADNESVTKSARDPIVKLSKKHVACSYNRCREAVAAGMIRVAHVASSENLSDLLTKSLPATQRDKLMDEFMY